MEWEKIECYKLRSIFCVMGFYKIIQLKYDMMNYYICQLYLNLKNMLILSWMMEKK